MTTNSISSYITLISIAHNQYGDELNIDNWNCEFMEERKNFFKGVTNGD